MSAIGGSIESVSIRSRLFPVAADADAGLKKGGKENEVQANGNGTARLIQTTVPWSLDGVALSIDHDKDDLDFLQEIADGKEFIPIAITLASGDTWHGKGQIVGEVKAQTQNATAPINFMGSGKLTKQ